MSANRMIASAAERYRLAWTSARQRAANHLAALVDADEERGFLRQVSNHLDGRLTDALTERDEARRQRDHHHGMYEQARDLAVRLEGERDEAREALEYAQIQIADHTALGRRLLAERDEALRERDLAIAHDRQPYPTAWAYEQACSALERTRTERDEARDEAVRLGEGIDRLADRLAAGSDDERDAAHHIRQILGADEVSAATDRLRAALTDVEVEERIEKIKASARERVAARQLRTALAEERIEPLPPADRYMMATTASHATGDLSRDEPDLAIVYGETEAEFTGEWATGFGFVNVRFPKATTRPLTDEERQFYGSKVLDVAGAVRPIRLDDARTEGEAG